MGFIEPNSNDIEKKKSEFISFTIMTIFQFLLYAYKSYIGVGTWRLGFTRKGVEEYYMISYTTYIYMITFSVLVAITKFNWQLFGLIASADVF